jgi:hypothetical protein
LSFQLRRQPRALFKDGLDGGILLLVCFRRLLKIFAVLFLPGDFNCQLFPEGQFLLLFFHGKISHVSVLFLHVALELYHAFPVFGFYTSFFFL